MTAPEHWPIWTVDWEVADAAADHGAPAAEDYLDEERAVAVLQGGGVARADRDRSRTRLQLPQPPSAHALLHPHLAITALISAHWLGRRSFHAGAFVHGGGAWAVLGDRERGKSSLLAGLAARGLPILADDVLVLEGDTAFAGPRVLDLRPDAAHMLQAGTDLGRVGTRERWRVELGPVPAEVPLRGWIDLAWSDPTENGAGAGGEAVEVSEVPIGERLARLVAARGIDIAEGSTPQWLPLLGMPMLRLERPRDWGRRNEVERSLLGAVEAFG